MNWFLADFDPYISFPSEVEWNASDYGRCTKRGSDMALDWFNGIFLYQCGRDLQALITEAEGGTQGSILLPAIRAGVQLDILYSHRVMSKPLLPLPTSMRLAIELREMVEKLIRTRPETMEDTAKPLEPYGVAQLKEKVREFQTVLGADLGKAATYVVRRLGILDVDSLIFNASDVFEGYRERIPEQCIWDTNQAGRCMAFELPTAAGFHVARATEAVLLKYMNAFGVAPTRESQRNWGQYTTMLREQVTGNVKPAERVLTAIDQIRILHRNPLLHPEQSLIIPEALSLWAICCSTIQAMIGDMEQKEKEPKAEILRLLPPEE